MKTIAFVILLFASCFGMAFAQGNLQFNQVRKIQWSAATTANNTFYQILGPYVVTVPVGKVLKIESLSVSRVRVPNTTLSAAYGLWGNYQASLWLEETCIVTNPGFATNNQDHVANQIIWLPEGNHNFYIGAEATGTATIHNLSAMLTAIEFNVVP